MVNELVNRNTGEVVQQSLSVVEVRAQVNLIQEVMKNVMQKDQHYGVIPGCGNKPTLLKAGAEKIATTFRLAANPDITIEANNDHEFTVTVKCNLTHIIAGYFVGAGVGRCSSLEEKYNWKRAFNDIEFSDTPEDKKRIKQTSRGPIKQIKTNPADVANTILKMAKKRALVDAILTATAASDIFTQDIEELPQEQNDYELQELQEAGTKEEQVKAWEPSKKQVDRFWAIANSHGFEEKEVREILFKTCKTEHLHDLTKEQYDRLCGDESKKRNSYFKELVIARGEKAAQEL